MPRYTGQKGQHRTPATRIKQSTGNKTLDSRMKRIKEEQVIRKINLQMSPSAENKSFEETISSLYGVPGIGKTKFAYELGLALQEKHSLDLPGVYFLQCEMINHPWKIRHSYLPNWPTFRKFIDDAERDPNFVSTVKMWVIDTIDGIVPKGISTICSDFGVADLKDATVRVGIDGWYAKAWTELRDEMLYQILRLAHLGPGVLILSHERYRKTMAGRVQVESASMDISNSIYNAIAPACGMILRMRLELVDEYEGRTPPRCLATLKADDEEAKDNLNNVLSSYEDGIIPFETEADAVTKLLACFDSGAKPGRKEVHSQLPRRRRKKKAAK